MYTTATPGSKLYSAHRNIKYYDNIYIIFEQTAACRQRQRADGYSGFNSYVYSHVGINVYYNTILYTIGLYSKIII